MADAWMVYGAYGYTGRLVLERAVAAGYKPVVAGRDPDRTESVALEFGLPFRSFELSDTEALRRGLKGMRAVLHCAGPFSATAAPMIAACLQVGTHYLDITGEIDVFAYAHANDSAARKRNVALVPGVGFDVVPTDCLAAMLKFDLPDASELVLAFDAGGGPSRGTALTSVDALEIQLTRNGTAEQIFRLDNVQTLNTDIGGGGGGGDSVVPEPGTLSLFALALVYVGFHRHRMRKTARPH